MPTDPDAIRSPQPWNAALCALALCGIHAAAHGSPRYQDTGEIDRLVAEFTGRPVGSMGGARQPVDPRLRLSACAVPLRLEWHSSAQRSVRVECPAAPGWRIFVNLVPPPAATPRGNVVRRGETVTIAIRGSGFTIRRQGEAQSSGSVGEWIKVRTRRRGQALHARVERPGLVVIPFSRDNAAGHLSPAP